ncbi:MAG: hypothetical protein HQK76_07045 [Desulfobacterales bacterium]|nr:hypothetical protein [Desulfobacterales bacterium]
MNQYRIIKIIFIFFVTVLIFQFICEWCLNIPVTKKPDWCEAINAKSYIFYWNRVSGFPKWKQRFNIQIASDIEFKDIFFSKTLMEEYENVYHDLFEKRGPYYFRVRVVIGERHFGWSKVIKFYGSKS